MITSVTHGSNPAVSRNLGYDPHNDLKPIVWLAQAPHALLVTRKLSVQTVSELVDLIRSQPGRLNYGSGGVGSMHHLGMVMLVRRWKKVVSRGVVRSVYLAGPHSAQRNSSTL